MGLQFVMVIIFLLFIAEQLEDNMPLVIILFPGWDGMKCPSYSTYLISWTS